jgi:hypothetical protein
MTTENEVEVGGKTLQASKTIKENYDALKATIEALTIDYEKFNDKKVKAAGARVRNNLLNCKKLCDTLRKQVLSDIKSLPTKHRVKLLAPQLQKDYENPPPPSSKSQEDAGKIFEKVKKPRKQRKANKKKSVTEINSV